MYTKRTPARTRRGRYCLVVVALTAAAVGITSPSGAATSCTFDAATKIVSVVLDSDGDVATLGLNGTEITVNGSGCLDTSTTPSSTPATVTNTATIDIDAVATGTQFVLIDLSTGNFVPGDNPDDEIDFTVDMGESSGDADLLQISGGTGADDIRVGDLGAGTVGVALNNAATIDPGDDREVIATGVELVTLTGGDGNDLLSGDGGGGTGGPHAGPIFFNGGFGDDTLRGGAGDDTFHELDTSNGADEFFGGAHIAGDVVDYCDRFGAISADADDQPDDGAAGEGDNVHADVERITSSPPGTGCPSGDDDSDGTINSQDSCPLNPGPPSNNGCPEAQPPPSPTPTPTPTPTPSPSPSNTLPNCDADTCGTTGKDDLTVNQGVVRTGGGDDHITLEVDDSTSQIFLFCGSGNDTVTLDLSAAADTGVDIYVDCAAGNDTITVPGDPQELQGLFRLSGGDDTFTVGGGTPARARVSSQQATTTGAYEVHGGTGNDIVTTGLGRDTLVGGFGSDRIDGRRGRDFMSGGFGFDVIEGGGGNDSMDAGSGEDVLHGGGGANSFNGGPGRDRCLSDTKEDVFSGCERIVRNHRRNH